MPRASSTHGVFPAAGGPARQETQSTSDAVFAVSTFPADDRFLYTADQAGNELNHLYVRTLAGDSIDLTPGEGLKASFAGWREDDRAFFALTNERDPKHFDLYRYDVPLPGARAYPRTLVFENTEGFSVSSVSRDGRWVALGKIRNNADSDVYALELTGDAGSTDGMVHVTPHEGEVSHGALTFTPDSKRLYYSSNEDSEFAHVRSFDLATGKSKIVLEDSWDVSGVSFSRQGRYRITTVNADARTRVTIRDLERGRDVRIPNLPRGDLTGVQFSRDEDSVAFYVNGSTSPSNLFVLDMESRDYLQLTESLNPAIDGSDLVEAQVVRYPSFDKLPIPALLYRPHQASKLARAPALVWVHGGPGGQSRSSYSPMIQHLVNHGYAVLAVNNRGSSGYGKTFFHLDDKRHGDVDLKDCIWGRRYLESLDWVDGDKVGIIGGSYGGYMVAAALAFEPEAFELGIDIFGVTNWLRTLESIPPWWETFRESLYAELGDPAVERDRLHANSPLFHAHNITRPLLVIQGANDPRVLQVESDEIVKAVEANGVPVEYIVFENEGHGFRNKENRITASEAYLKFADRYLLGEAP